MSDLSDYSRQLCHKVCSAHKFSSYPNSEIASFYARRDTADDMRRPCCDLFAAENHVCCAALRWSRHLTKIFLISSSMQVEFTLLNYE